MALGLLDIARALQMARQIAQEQEQQEFQQRHAAARFQLDQEEARSREAYQRGILSAREAERMAREAYNQGRLDQAKEREAGLNTRFGIGNETRQRGQDLSFAGRKLAAQAGLERGRMGLEGTTIQSLMRGGVDLSAIPGYTNELLGENAYPLFPDGVPQPDPQLQLGTPRPQAVPMPQPGAARPTAQPMTSPPAQPARSVLPDEPLPAVKANIAQTEAETATEKERPALLRAQTEAAQVKTEIDRILLKYADATQQAEIRRLTSVAALNEMFTGLRPKMHQTEAEKVRALIQRWQTLNSVALRQAAVAETNAAVNAANSRTQAFNAQTNRIRANQAVSGEYSSEEQLKVRKQRMELGRELRTIKRRLTELSRPPRQAGLFDTTTEVKKTPEQIEAEDAERASLMEAEAAIREEIQALTQLGVEMQRKRTAAEKSGGTGTIPPRQPPPRGSGQPLPIGRIPIPPGGFRLDPATPPILPTQPPPAPTTPAPKGAPLVRMSDQDLLEEIEGAAEAGKPYIEVLRAMGAVAGAERYKDFRKRLKEPMAAAWRRGNVRYRKNRKSRK